MTIFTLPAFAVSFVLLNFNWPPGSALSRNVWLAEAACAGGGGGDADELLLSSPPQPAIARPIPTAAMTGILESVCMRVLPAPTVDAALSDAADRRFLP